MKRGAGDPPSAKRSDAENSSRSKSDFSSAGKCEINKGSKGISTLGAKRLFIALAINNIVTVVAQIVVVLVLGLMWVIPGTGEGITSLFSVPAMVAVTLVLCVISGFLLMPLPKYNFASVVGPFLPVIIHTSLEPSADFQTYFTNFALSLVLSVLIYLGLRLKIWQHERRQL